jgi:hypothetical protein
MRVETPDAGTGSWWDVGYGERERQTPGKSRLNFDHILSRLQGELWKIRETGAELHNLTSAMNDIHMPSVDCGESIILLYS